jgi:hypothetical protein
LSPSHGVLSAEQPGSQAVETLHVCIVVMFSWSLSRQGFDREIQRWCATATWALEWGWPCRRWHSPFCHRWQEHFKLWIVSLYPLPFTSANVFFVSLGWLNFPHVLSSFSSQLPRASHNKPACFGVLAGGAAEMHTGYAFGCVYQSQPRLPWLKQRSWPVQVAWSCLHSSL